jgi:hypothetical protein
VAVPRGNDVHRQPPASIRLTLVLRSPLSCMRRRPARSRMRWNSSEYHSWRIASLIRNELCAISRRA